MDKDPNKEAQCLFAAAIDFGTTYSGWAFSAKIDPVKVYIKHWVDPTSSMMFNKTSTCILFDGEKKFSRFGFEAEAKYMDLILDEEQENWYLFRRFKMSLFNMQSSDDDLCLEDEMGKRLPDMAVFSESIKYLKQSLLDEVQKQHTDIVLDDIKWILTVPAIWSDPAKAFMRRAAVKAGINNKLLTLALEPEAAAFFLANLPVDKLIGGTEEDVFKSFSAGSKHMVVDAGGGTVDITAHEMLQNGRVREIIAANGGNGGGTRVDEEYLDFIKCLVGESVTDFLKQNAPYVFFEVCRDFENAKRSLKPMSDIRFSVRIPFELFEKYEHVNPRKKLESTKVVLTKRNKAVNVYLKGDKLRLASKYAEDFFTESVEAITCHMKELLHQKDGRDISTIILVGGYAESPVLVQGIKSSFPEMRIIVPQEAAWSVLRGAVIFGHDPSFIEMRRSKFFYGISVFEKFDPSKHDEKYKYKEDGEVRCGKLFSKLIEFNELMSVGE